MPEVYVPKISELQTFVACARLGATTRAADNLHLTQSAVSRSLNALEDRLGVRLFHRVRQRLILSDAGRAMLPEAEAVLRDLRDAALKVMAFGGRTELLRLAALPSFASQWLVPRLADFQRQAPNTTFDIGARLDAVQFDSEPVDAALQRFAGRPGPGLNVDELMPEFLVVVAAPGILAGRAPADDNTLIDLPLLQQATRPSLWLDWFRHTGLDVRTILRGARFEHFDMVVNAAIAGLGVALVPEILVRQHLAGGRLVLASPRRQQTETPYCLIYPDRSNALPSFRRFRDWLIAAAALSAAEPGYTGAP